MYTQEQGYVRLKGGGYSEKKTRTSLKELQNYQLVGTVNILCKE